MLRGDQPRENAHAAGRDDEIVKAAPIALATIFDDPQPPPVGAIFGRQLLQPDDAVRDAVHGLVVGFGRQVIEHQDGRSASREIMLQRQDLAAVAQRSLRQQANFRKAVEHDAVGLTGSKASKMRFVVSPSSRSEE